MWNCAIIFVRRNVSGMKWHFGKSQSKEQLKMVVLSIFQRNNMNRNCTIMEKHPIISARSVCDVDENVRGEKRPTEKIASFFSMYRGFFISIEKKKQRKNFPAPFSMSWLKCWALNAHGMQHIACHHAHWNKHSGLYFCVLLNILRHKYTLLLNRDMPFSYELTRTPPQKRILILDTEKFS